MVKLCMKWIESQLVPLTTPKRTPMKNTIKLKVQIPDKIW
jgi:hypothetical protein